MAVSFKALNFRILKKAVGMKNWWSETLGFVDYPND